MRKLLGTTEKFISFQSKVQSGGLIDRAVNNGHERQELHPVSYWPARVRCIGAFWKTHGHRKHVHRGHLEDNGEQREGDERHEHRAVLGAPVPRVAVDDRVHACRQRQRSVRVYKYKYEFNPTARKSSINRQQEQRLQYCTASEATPKHFAHRSRCLCGCAAALCAASSKSDATPSGSACKSESTCGGTFLKSSPPMHICAWASKRKLRAASLVHFEILPSPIRVSK